MDFPEVWRLQQKQETLNPQTYTSNVSAVRAISSRTPLVKMVSKLIALLPACYDELLLLQVSILTPEVDTTELERILQDSHCYSCENFNISDIFGKSFVEGFLETGKFSLMPAEYSDVSDSIVVTENKLVMRLHKDTLYSESAVELSKYKIGSDDEFHGERACSCTSDGKIYNFRSFQNINST